MNRKEAIETVDAVDYFGMSTEHKVELSKAFVNKIYDDFESRNCLNCKLYCESDDCIVKAFNLGLCHFTNESEFSCNKWEHDGEETR